MDYRNVEENLRASFAVIAASHGAGEVREIGGVSIASAAVTFQMFNAAFLAAPVNTDAELERRRAQAEVYFQARGLGWSLWVCEDWLAGGPRRRLRWTLTRQGLRFSTSMPGMAAERVRPPVRPLPRMEFRRVAGGAEREAFCAIGSMCFRVPSPWFREVFEPQAVWRDFASWVGYVDGEAVSTASTVVAGGAVGVYNVGTLPGHQRQGYGEAVMRHALEAARAEHGIERTVLQSTPAGLQLYQRMGYQEVTRVSVYAS